MFAAVKTHSKEFIIYCTIHNYNIDICNSKKVNNTITVYTPLSNEFSMLNSYAGY